METIVNQTQAAGWFTPAAYAAILAVAVSGAALVLLHVFSPEFQLSWRMVSEYANGQHKWLLSIVFAGWALSSFLLIAALWPLFDSTLGKVALAFLLLAAIGQTMGLLFDVNHPLHGPAALIGIPSLCIAAVLVTLALGQRPDIAAPPIWSAHLPWISFVLMLGALFLFFSSLKAVGVEMSPQAPPLQDLPAGVSGYVGWANRLLFGATYLWAVLTALAVIRTGT